MIDTDVETLPLPIFKVHSVNYLTLSVKNRPPYIETIRIDDLDEDVVGHNVSVFVMISGRTSWRHCKVATKRNLIRTIRESIREIYREARKERSLEGMPCLRTMIIEKVILNKNERLIECRIDDIAH